MQRPNFTGNFSPSTILCRHRVVTKLASTSFVTTFDFSNWIIIGAHISPSHKTVFIKFPVLVSMSPQPLASFRVSPFVFKAH